jgi:hypothetical protein
VGVMAERASPDGLSRPDKPELRVLARTLVGRAEQRRDREAAGPTLLQTGER